MSNLDIYYKKALQAFAYSLNVSTDKERANMLLRETSEKVLKQEILTWKEKLSEKEFYYDAGRVVESVLTDAANESGIKGINDCVIGLNQFELFIGLQKDT